MLILATRQARNTHRSGVLIQRTHPFFFFAIDTVIMSASLFSPVISNIAVSHGKVVLNIESPLVFRASDGVYHNDRMIASPFKEKRTVGVPSLSLPCVTKGPPASTLDLGP